jgi:hypothetical protein
MTYSRANIMRDAHRRYRQGLRLCMGWTFAQCLSTAWAAAKQRRDCVAAYHSADMRTRKARDFIFLQAA